MTISFDIMGFDNNPKEALKAIWSYSKNNKNINFIVVGNKKIYDSFVLENGKLKNVSLEPTSVFIKQDDNPLAYRSKKNNSMSIAINLVKNKKANAVISAGNSASFIFGCLITINKLYPKVSPAFMPIFPTIKGKYPCLLDVGANISPTPESIHSYGVMASIFHKAMFNTKKPSVGLLNIGSEPSKGTENIKKAYQLLKDDKKINFYGNIEARDLLTEKVNIIVCDGWTGNITLKTAEGAMTFLGKLINNELRNTTFRAKIGGLLLKKSLNKVKEKFNYKNVGGAFVIGVDGICIKAHGSSDEKSLMGAISQAHLAMKNNIIEKLKKGF